MNYSSSNYFYKKIRNFFPSTISPFVLFILWRKDLHLGKKGGKDFACENYVKIEKEKPFHNTSERLTTIRSIIFLKSFRKDIKLFE